MRSRLVRYLRLVLATKFKGPETRRRRRRRRSAESARIALKVPERMHVHPHRTLGPGRFKWPFSHALSHTRAERFASRAHARVHRYFSMLIVYRTFVRTCVWLYVLSIAHTSGSWQARAHTRVCVCVCTRCTPRMRGFRVSIQSAVVWKWTGSCVCVRC